MANVFLKRIATAWDRVARNNLNDNFNDIEKGFAKTTDELHAHKNAPTAHKSTQIQHGLFDVGNRLDNYGARFANLVVNHDGEDVKEVVDLRVALDATTHLTAKDRFDYDFAKLLRKFDYLPDVNVVELGADPTGQKDSLSAIQAALDKAKNGKSVRVYIPPGTYKISAYLVTWGNTLVSAKDAVLLNYGGRYMMTNGDGKTDYYEYKGNGNIVIDGGTWDCRGTKIGMRSNTFSFGHAENILIKDAVFKDVPSYHAIEFNACRNFKVVDSSFVGFVDIDGTRYFSEAIQLDLAQRPAVFGAFGAYDFTTCKNGLVDNCYFGASGTPGTQAWPRGVGSHSSTIGYWHENITIRNSTFDSTEGWAIRGYNWMITKITGNTLRNCKFGITSQAINPANITHTMNDKFEQLSRSQPFNHVVISDNTILNTRENEAIHVRGYNDTGIIRNVNIVGNIIDGVGGTSQAGIRMDAVRNGLVAANQISNTSGDGVWMNDCVGVTVSGANQISFIGRDGISAFGESSDLLINGNLIRRPARYGIEQSGVLFSVITSNLITGAGYKEHGKYESIRIANGARSVLVAGNKCRSISTITQLARAGIYITSTVRGVIRYGNDCRGDWSIGGVVDNAPDTVTSASDTI
ncbi:hypothetical protein CSE15_16175 [Bacillus altitudinis]|uniref:glycosyl hydrolase family 28-related protein n=1 Tax=Bacillus altitudinis TaxID=293387 RepID=UPI000C156836|nr:glycosyl hydrolase family 28-related protein [Bacillus altitudinis]ATP95383.1 hypothetical protein CSE15_16175 [Bacillus altitudinis]